MTIKEFLKSIDYEVETEVMGETEKFKYYIQTDLPKDEDTGIPLMVIENKAKNTFEVASSDQTFAVWDQFLS